MKYVECIARRDSFNAWKMWTRIVKHKDEHSWVARLDVDLLMKGETSIVNLSCEPQLWAKLHKLSFELDLVCFILFNCLSNMLYELWREKISIIYDLALEKNVCEKKLSAISSREFFFYSIKFERVS